MFSLISVRSLTDTLRFILLGFLGFNALSCILTCFLSTAWRSKGSLVTIDSAEPRCSHSGSYECRERKGNTVSIRSLKSIVHVKIRQVFKISLKAIAICSLVKCPRPWVLSSILCPVPRQQCHVMHTVYIVGLIYTVQLQYTLSHTSVNDSGRYGGSGEYMLGMLGNWGGLNFLKWPNVTLCLHPNVINCVYKLFIG